MACRLLRQNNKASTRVMKYSRGILPNMSIHWTANADALSASDFTVGCKDIKEEHHGYSNADAVLYVV